MKIFSVALFWVNIIFGLSLVFCDLSLMYVPRVLLWSFWILFSGSVFYGILRQQLLGFFFKRVGASIIVIAIIASMTFLLLRFLPGGPFDEEKALPPIVKANIEKKYGLDQPLWKQYFNYMGGLLRGHLGYSYKYEGREVSAIIRDSFPVSFKLGFYALVLSFFIGIPLGLFAASRYGTRLDSGAMILAISGISLPSFLVAPILIYIFSFGWPLDIFAPSLYQWLLQNNLLLPPALWHSPAHYILPVVTLGIRPAAFIARLTRASVLDVIQADFVRTARSKGLSEKVVLYHHVLRNSLVPVLTYVGPLTAGILSGSFVVEVIFAIPGIAKYFVQSVFNRDYPLILALTILFSIMLILANLLVDILYKVVDPRMEVS
ncbi:MAG: ABC transporter permease [Bdellovibrionales bacterium]|nr:ABC transporter permease [Bdellovibrionales bacterium]